MIRKGHPSTFTLMTLLAGLAAFVAAAKAETITWQGTSNSSWGNAANWSPARVPGSGDVAVFPSGVTNNSINLNGNRVVGAIDFANGAPNYTINGNNALTLESGTVNVSSGGAIHTLNCPVVLMASDRWTVSGASQLIANGVVSENGGSFGIDKRGNGRLTLNAENTLTGLVEIRGGAIEVGTNRALQHNTIELTGPDQLFFSANAPNGVIGNLSGSGDYNTGTTALTLGGNNEDVTYTGVLSGSQDMTKVGTGTWILTGDSSSYRRTIDVSEGTLQLDGSLGSQSQDRIWVSPGGTLSGVGTVANIKLEGGTISPGSPLGTLNTIFDFEFAFTGLFQGETVLFELGGTTQGVDYDSFYAGEIFAAAQARIVIRYVNGFTASPGDEFVIAEAGSVVFHEGEVEFPDDQGWYLIQQNQGDVHRLILRVCNELGVDCNSNGIPDLCELDQDGDGVPDDCDLCPGSDDTLDDDGDGVPNDCDSCQGDDASGDSDNDGICDSDDICPGSDDAGPDGDGDGVPDACDFCATTETGDIDGDRDIDFDDLAGFDACLTGPGVLANGACNCFDADGDGAVTLADYAIIQAAASGSGVIAEGPGEINIENMINGVSDWGFAILGQNGDDFAGYSVAMIDDLNGDGLSEMLIGAPSWGGGQRRRAGRAYVVYGRTDLQNVVLSDIAAGIGGFALEGEFGRFDHDFAIAEIGEEWVNDEGPDGEGAGFAVASAGDVNGDGRADMLISAPYAPVNGNEPWGGRTYVVFGSDDLASPAPLDLGAITAPGAGGGFFIEGVRGRCLLDTPCANARGASSSGDLAGWSVSGARDVNGDGLADVVIGAPLRVQNDRGSGYVVWGTADTATISLADVEEDPALGFRLSSSTDPTRHDRFGHRVSALGDFTGDGLADVLVQAWALGQFPAFLTHGRANGSPVDLTTATPDLTVLDPGFREEPQSGGLILGRPFAGTPAQCAGDFNGDGRVDWVASVVNIQEQPSVVRNEVYVIFGSADDVGTTIDLDDRFGIYNDTFATPDRGVKIVLSDFDTVEEWRWEISSVGDVNADGFDDLVIGMGNRTAVVFGRPDSVVLDSATALDGQQGLLISGSEPDDQHGWSVTAAGDINGDGINDILMGAPLDDTIDVDAGGAYLVYGTDFNGAITHHGTDAPDVITGTAGADNIVGGRGSDIVTTDGGADTVYLGAGDDTVILTDTDFHRLRGGPGLDTIRISDSATLDLEALRGRIEGFEQIQLLSGGADIVSIRTIDVLNMNATSNDLTITGAGALIALGDNWVRDLGFATGGSTLIKFTDGRAELYVDEQISLRFSPTVTTTAVSVAENSPVDTSVGMIGAVDPDGGTVVSFAIVGGDGQGTFAIDADTGELTVIGAIDFETHPTYTLQIAVTDNSGDIGTRTVSVNVIGVNEAPVWTVQDFVATLAEHAPTGTSVGTFTAVDPDVGDSVTYFIDVEDASLTSPALLGAFAIDATTGELTVADGTLLDREASEMQQLLVYAQDTEDLRSVPSLVSITLDDVQMWQISLSSAFVTTGASMWDTDGAVLPSTLMFEQRIDGSDSGAQNAEFLGVDVSVDVEGALEYSAAITTGPGSVDANVPFEAELSIDDEIALGQPFMIDFDVSNLGDPTLSGTTPNVDMDLLLELDEFEVLTSFRNFGPWSGSNNGEEYLVSGFQDSWEATVQPDGSLSTGSFRTTLLRLGQLDWDSYLLTFLELADLPANEGTFDVTSIPGFNVEVQYILWTMTITGALHLDQELSLDVDGYQATIVFENGDSQPLTVDGATQVTLPTDADTNDDGRVDFEVHIDVDTTFSNYSDYVGTLTPRSTKGYLHMTGFSTDVPGPPQEAEIGPVIDIEVPVDIGDDDAGVPTPWPSGETGQFPLGGFNTVVMTGSIDLMN